MKTASERLEELAVISDNAKAIKYWRRGLLVRWPLHNGIEFRQESIPLQYIDKDSEVQKPNDVGQLVVMKIWAETRCITPIDVFMTEGEIEKYRKTKSE